MKRKEMLLLATILLLVSAVANGLIADDFSHIATIILSVLGSISLALTIYYHSVEVER